MDVPDFGAGYCFGLTGRPASCQAAQPPVRALALGHPARRSSRATRALVASSCQVVDRKPQAVQFVEAVVRVVFAKDRARQNDHESGSALPSRTREGSVEGHCVPSQRRIHRPVEYEGGHSVSGSAQMARPRQVSGLVRYTNSHQLTHTDLAFGWVRTPGPNALGRPAGRRGWWSGRLLNWEATQNFINAPLRCRPANSLRT